MLGLLVGIGAARQAAAAPAPIEGAAYGQCITRAATAFRIPELPLWVILDVERGQVGKVSRNTNGTYDIGPAQVNSSHLRHLARLGITEQQVRDDLCVNIYVAAWLYASEYRRFGDVAKAIAHYHSPTPRHQRRYLGLVHAAINQRIAMLEQRRARLVAGGGNVPPIRTISE